MSDSTTLYVICGGWLGLAILFAVPYWIKWEKGQKFIEKIPETVGLIIAILIGMMIVSGMGS